MNILVIADTHAPFMHKNYVKFLKDIYEAEDIDTVVHIGDLVDGHSLGNWMKDPDGFSCGTEWKKTIEQLQELYETFPDVHWMTGNHDNRPYRKAFDMGMSKDMIKPLNDIYDCPEGWSVHTELELDGVLFTHGEGAGGYTGWQNYCNVQNLSTVFGHFHGVGGVRYFQNKQLRQIFSMCVGAGVDENSYAMAYGKHHKHRPILGCGVVKDGKYAKFVPMDMTNRSYKGYKNY